MVGVLAIESFGTRLGYSSVPCIRSNPLGESIMFLRFAAFMCALCASTASFSDDVQQVRIRDLTAGSRFEFSTAEHVYRGEIVNPITGEARLAASADGLHFTLPQSVFLLGATQGRSAETGELMLVKMDLLQTGLRVELGLGSLDERD